MNTAEQFFYDHADYSHAPHTETPEQGRARCAVELATAEAWASLSDISFTWGHDGFTNREWTDEGDEYNTWICQAYDVANDVQLDVLGGIDLGPDGHPRNDPYARVVEAQLALNVMRKRTAE